MQPDTPPPADPIVSFSGRTPSRSSAIRAGMFAGGALIVAVGAAVVTAASPGPSTSGTGAQPSAATSGPGTGRPNGNGFGHGGFGGFGGFLGPDPFGLGPGTAAGPIDGFGPGNGGRPGLAFGRITVSAISGSNLSLTTEDGWTRTITVTPDTTITKGGQPAKLGDIKIGDIVRFAEKRNSDGTWTITALAVVLPQAAGTVTAIGADSITISGRDGTTQTIRTTSSTVYHRSRSDGTRADVKVGSRILAVGERASDGSLTATSVTVALPVVAGSVTAVTSDTITITRRDGTTMTIHVGSDTTIGVAGIDKATIADIKAGMFIAAEGVQRGDGSLDATAIQTGAIGKGRDRDKAPNAVPGASAVPSVSQG